MLELLKELFDRYYAKPAEAKAGQTTLSAQLEYAPAAVAGMRLAIRLWWQVAERPDQCDPTTEKGPTERDRNDAKGDSVIVIARRREKPRN